MFVFTNIKEVGLLPLTLEKIVTCFFHNLEFFIAVYQLNFFPFRSAGPGGPGMQPPREQSKRLQQTQAQVDEVCSVYVDGDYEKSWVKREKLCAI